MIFLVLETCGEADLGLSGVPKKSSLKIWSSNIRKDKEERGHYSCPHCSAPFPHKDWCPASTSRLQSPEWASLLNLSVATLPVELSAGFLKISRSWDDIFHYLHPNYETPRPLLNKAQFVVIKLLANFLMLSIVQYQNAEWRSSHTLRHFFFCFSGSLLWENVAELWHLSPKPFKLDNL